MTVKRRSSNLGGGRNSAFRRLIAFVLLFCIVATILFLFFFSPAISNPAVSSSPTARQPELSTPSPLETPAIQQPTVSPITSPKASVVPAKHILYIIIDDAGNNLESTKRFLAFPGKLTFAVLPGLHYSRAVARLVRQHGQGLILHQPMEAMGGQNPGPGVIKRGMSVAEIQQQLAINLDELETPSGVNNHMGSRGTQDSALLDAMMQVIKERQLFFLDSRTSAKSRAIEVAHKLGVPAVERDVFLDNDQNKDAILQALQEGTKIAEKRGYAVMIGHAWSAELAQVLIDTYPHLVEQGYDFDSLVNYFLGGKGFTQGSTDVREKSEDLGSE